MHITKGCSTDNDVVMLMVTPTLFKAFTYHEME